MRTEISCGQLQKLYVEEQLSAPEIAARLGCTTRTVYNHMLQCGIQSRSASESAMLDRGLDISCEELRELYEEKLLTFAEIAEHFGCNPTTIHKKIKACGISSRPAGGNAEEYAKKDFNGDILLKAYLMGFRLGDLHVEEGNWAIRIRCTSTHQAQLALIHDLFIDYGGVWVGKSHDKRGAGITVHLNRSFDFLIPKEDAIPPWVLEDNESFLAFFAGYSDAEGSFILSNSRAYFKIDSGDKNILNQARRKFKDLGVEFPEPKLIRPSGTWIEQFQLSSKLDLWRLASERKETLIKLCEMLSPYLRHQKRVQDMQAVHAYVLTRMKI
jgi:predicted DNA-binding protein YlxM (UPF0122 family)